MGSPGANTSSVPPKTDVRRLSEVPTVVDLKSYKREVRTYERHTLAAARASAFERQILLCKDVQVWTRGKRRVRLLSGGHE